MRLQTALWLHVAAFCLSGNGERTNGPNLLPWASPPLPLGSVTPLGWLHGELRAMGDGLAGHEMDFYPYIKDSPWLNGTSEYSKLNEGLPYWFNGLVPLAYVLNDQRLKNQVHSAASTVLRLQSQHQDGWLGPETGADQNMWGRVPFMLGLIQLAEANSTGWHQPVVDSLTRYLRRANFLLKDRGAGYVFCMWDASPLDCSWGQIRMHDALIVIQWLLENARLEAKDVAMLWETMDLFYDLSDWKWETWYTEDSYQKEIPDPRPSNPIFPFLHGVNVGQGLKSAAVIRRFIHDDNFITSASNAVEWTFKYHGAPSGTILADESQRDLAPFMGSELCTAVETGYSLAYLYHALGTNSFADRAELVIYNALPVMLTHDMWGHQYMSRPNGPWAQRQLDRPSLFTTSGGMATVFGLEPQYPCCTVNHPQGYPKFLANSWARAENGLAHVLLSPSVVNTTVPNVGRVVISCETNYPFSSTLEYAIDSEAPFDFYIRLPSWAVASASTLVVAKGAGAAEQVNITVSPDSKTGLQRVKLSSGKSRVIYTVGSAIRVEARERGAVSVYVGNLLYALDVGEAITTSLPHRYFDAAGEGTREFGGWDKVRDFYISNTKPWNIAIDPNTLQYHPGNATGLLQRGFTPETSNFLTVRGCEIRWAVRESVAPDLPPRGENCQGEIKDYKLIPYGLAKVHMSELPIVKITGNSSEPVVVDDVYNAVGTIIPLDL